MITDRREGFEMSVVVVVTVIPIPEHRPEGSRPSRWRSPRFTKNQALSSTHYTRAATA